VIVSAKSQADLLALARKTVPQEWWDSRIDGDGGEILYEEAMVLARASLAVERLYRGLTAGTAPLGAYATGSVRMARTGSAAGGLHAGSVIETVFGDAFALDETVYWTAGDTSDQLVAVTALQQSYQSDALVGTPFMVRVPSPAPLWDTTLTIHAEAEFTGGSTPLLEEHALSKGLPAMSGESAAALRNRLRGLPDQVSPAAVLRVARQVILEATLHEAWQLAPFLDYWYLGGALDPADPGRGERLHPTGQAEFLVRVPNPQVGTYGDDWFFCGYAYLGGGPLDGCYLPLWLGATELGILAMIYLYDYGMCGLPPLIAQLAARVNAAKPAGVLWHIEEY
jgi:hypothetical protein